MMDWAYGGASTADPYNASPECVNFINPVWRVAETTLVINLCLWVFLWSYSKLRLPTTVDYVHQDKGGKSALLVLMCLIWGIEIGFKFATKTVIYLLNPCHLMTAIQIYLLAAPPSKIVTAVFRFHLNYLNGPLLACLFPETDTRVLPLESTIYWIQHGMMFVVPYYLLRLGGVYNVEELTDFWWHAFSYSINLLYHFIVLQAVSISIQISLNHILCPTILDPFNGQVYRVCMIIHQAALSLLLRKLYCLIPDFFTKYKPTAVKTTLCCGVSTANNINGDMFENSHRHEE